MYHSDTNRQDRMAEISAKLEEGVRNVFTSGKYEEYLRTMSRFHRYSLSNTILIYLQKPDATRVASFRTWKEKFGRTVRKGEHGIRILAPVTAKTGAEPAKEDGTDTLPGPPAVSFRPVTVFDVSQTAGRDLPELAAPLADRDENAGKILAALTAFCPVPVRFADLPADTDGLFDPSSGTITVRSGMSSTQSACALVHETAHCLLHADPSLSPEKSLREVQAESVAYAVCAGLGLETGENSFGYIAAWSAGKELPELRESLDIIRRTAAQILDGAERELQAQRELEQAPEGFRIRENPSSSGYYDRFRLESGTEILFTGCLAQCRELLGALESGAFTPQQASETVPLTLPDRMLYGINGTWYLLVERRDDLFAYSLYGKDSYLLLESGSLDGRTLEDRRAEPFDAVRGEVCRRLGIEPVDVERMPEEKILQLREPSAHELPEYTDGEHALTRSQAVELAAQGACPELEPGPSGRVSVLARLEQLQKAPASPGVRCPQQSREL